MNNKEETAMTVLGIALIPFVLLYLLPFILHVWTIIVAFEESGLIAAVISFFLPVLSEVYWYFRIALDDGFFGTPYTIFISLLILCQILMVVIGVVMGRHLWKRK